MCSVFASFTGQGVVSGAVALGALSLVWIPVLSTIETVEDLSSVLVARFLDGRDPGPCPCRR